MSVEETSCRLCGAFLAADLAFKEGFENLLAQIDLGIRFEKLEDRSLPSFVAAPSFPVGLNGGGHSNPQAVVTGDFNRDGLLDVATANNGGPFDSSGTDGVSILLGTGNGAFKPARNLFIGRRPVELATGDFNGDGKLDLVTANEKDNSVTVLLGSGTAVLGVLYAVMQRDLKRLLAYSTVENVGIIFVGLGLALAFKANGIGIPYPHRTVILKSPLPASPD